MGRYLWVPFRVYILLIVWLNILCFLGNIWLIDPNKDDNNNNIRMRCNFKPSNSDWARFQVLAFWSSPRLRLDQIDEIYPSPHSRIWNIASNSWWFHLISCIRHLYCISSSYIFVFELLATTFHTTFMII